MEKLKTLWLKLRKLIKGESVKMDIPVWKKKTEALINKEFISIKAYSGYRSATADPQAEEHLLDPEISDKTLGESVLKSLEQSRFLSLEEMQNLNINLKNNYEIWIKKIQNLYGYKTKKSMFRNMKSCSIVLDGNTVLIEPSYHERLEAWSGMEEEDTVKIPADSPSEDIGAALRLAFSRCKSKTF